MLVGKGRRTSTTTNVSPPAVHLTMSLYSGASSILHVRWSVHMGETGVRGPGAGGRYLLLE